MSTTKNAEPKATPVAPAPLAKFWKDWTGPGIWEVVKAVTEGGEWMIERQEDATWFVGHLPTQTEVKGGFRTLRAARVYIARGTALADFEALAPAPVTDAVTLAHVADAITELTGDDDYDTVAGQAARLLARVPSLAAEVARYGAFAIEWEHLTVIVQAALTVPAEPRVHAEAGASFPACGWIQDGETVAADPAAVTCRFCKDKVNADRIVEELAALLTPCPF